MNDDEIADARWIADIGHEYLALKRRLDELQVVHAADEDGALTELHAVLLQKRGCRR